MIACLGRDSSSCAAQSAGRVYAVVLLGQQLCAGASALALHAESLPHTARHVLLSYPSWYCLGRSALESARVSSARLTGSAGD